MNPLWFILPASLDLNHVRTKPSLKSYLFRVELYILIRQPCNMTNCPPKFSLILLQVTYILSVAHLIITTDATSNIQLTLHQTASIPEQMVSNIIALCFVLRELCCIVRSRSLWILYPWGNHLSSPMYAWGYNLKALAGSPSTLEYFSMILYYERADLSI